MKITTRREPKITFAQLRRLLVDVGFTPIVVPGSHIGFEHHEYDFTIMLPVYKPNQVVLPHHILTVRIQLDGSGLLDGEEFDRRLGRPAIVKPRLKFAKLRQLLLGLGFTKVVIPKSFVTFQHQASVADIFLPIYRSNQLVAPRHLAVVRMMLDAKGLMDRDEFDQFVTSETLKRRIS